jgi:hypothetical protein
MPMNISLDADGNYLAKYTLKPKSEIIINLKGLVRIYNKQIDPTVGGDFKNIPLDIRYKYTKSSEFWNTGDSEVKKVAKELLNKSETVSMNAERAYNYILSPNK